MKTDCICREGWHTDNTDGTEKKQILTDLFGACNIYSGVVESLKTDCICREGWHTNNTDGTEKIDTNGLFGACNIYSGIVECLKTDCICREGWHTDNTDGTEKKDTEKIQDKNCLKIEIKNASNL